MILRWRQMYHEFECDLNKYYSNWLLKHRFYIKQHEAFHLFKPFIKTEYEPSL